MFYPLWTTYLTETQRICVMPKLTVFLSRVFALFIHLFPVVNSSKVAPVLGVRLWEWEDGNVIGNMARGLIG